MDAAFPLQYVYSLHILLGMLPLIGGLLLFIWAPLSFRTWYTKYKQELQEDVERWVASIGPIGAQTMLLDKRDIIYLYGAATTCGMVAGSALAFAGIQLMRGHWPPI